MPRTPWLPEWRECPTCQTTFLQTRYGQVYCTPDHRPRQQSWRNATRQPKASTTDRGYGREHQNLRAQWTPKVDALEVDCWRCGQLIVPDYSLRGDGWDLGHHDHDRAQYRGPEHIGCNRATKTHAAQNPKPLRRRVL